MKINRYCISLLVILFILGLSQGRQSVVSAEFADEEAAVYKAAQTYLNAELKRDLSAVYDCLAPSSAYRIQNSYNAYLKEAKSSPVRIAEYKILRVHNLRNNHDRKTFPNVERFAKVEVDLKVYFSDVNKAADMNYDFTFMKEGGRWYKG